MRCQLPPKTCKWPKLSNVGSLTCFLAMSHSFTTVHISNNLNQDLAFPSSKCSGKQIIVPGAIVLGFSTNVITQEQLQQKITLTTQAHGQERKVTCQSSDTRPHMYQ